MKKSSRSTISLMLLIITIGLICSGIKLEGDNQDSGAIHLHCSFDAAFYAIINTSYPSKGDIDPMSSSTNPQILQWDGYVLERPLGQNT